jgi:tyrosine-protein phosphatase YwqE
MLRDVPLVDLHSHLVPGIDDGVRTYADAHRIIQVLGQIGYRKLIITPHVMKHRYDNDENTILEGFERLLEYLARHRCTMELEVSAEYYLDDHFIELVRRKEILSFGSRHLLFEMSYTVAPSNFFAAVELMKQKGYQPILAHPERYRFLHISMEKYHELKAHGLLFQLNVNSLGGFYGESIRRVAISLAEEGMVDFVGTDTHGFRYLEALKRTLLLPEYRAVFEKNRILNDTLL